MRYLLSMLLSLVIYADNCSEIRNIVSNFKNQEVKIQKEDCADKNTLYNLGLLYYRTGNLLPAESLINRLAVDWKDPAVLFLLSKIEIKLDKKNEARQVLEQIKKIDKAYFPAALELVRLNYLENKENPCEPIKELNPYMAIEIAEAKLACAVLNKNKVEIESLSKVNSENQEFLKKVKIINLMISQNYLLAEAEVKSLKGEEHDLLRAIIQFHLGKLSLVRENVLTFVNSDSEPGLIEFLSYCLYKSGERVTFDEIMNQYPHFLNEPPIRKILAVWDYQLRNIKESEVSLRQVIEKAPDFFSLSYLIRILEDSKRFQEAAVYKKQLELSNFN